MDGHVLRVAGNESMSLLTCRTAANAGASRGIGRAFASPDLSGAAEV